MATSLTDVYCGVRKNSDQRMPNEFYPTSPVATYALTQHSDVPRFVWEPAAGRGWMSRELIRCGHNVISTDLFHYENPLVPVEFGVDFLSARRRAVEAIVTNPPYKNDLAQKFTERAIEEGYDYVAMFCRLTFAESSKRLRLFERYPPSTVIVMSGRVQCSEEYLNRGQYVGGMVSYAWWVWDKWLDQRTTTMVWADVEALNKKRNAEIGVSVTDF
jgi:hypothetical protein